MPLAEVITTNDVGLFEVEAIVQNAVHESLLQRGKNYLTGQNFDKTFTYKGATYTPGPLKIFTPGDTLTFRDAPPDFKFMVGTKIFQVVQGTSRRIVIIGGGEAVLWRTIVSIQPTDPTAITQIEPDQGIVTTSIAPTPNAYFYKVGGIWTSEPLSDGTEFRSQETAGAIVWRKYVAARNAAGQPTGEGIFEVVDGVSTAAIASTKNIDLSRPGDLQQIIDGLDTIDGKPYPGIGIRDGKRRIDQAILLPAQADTRQNGLYLFSCIEGDNNPDSIARLAPYYAGYLARIGRAFIRVWLGDKYGQNELFIKSATPIGPTSTQPRVEIGTTPHYWAASKPQIALEKKVEANSDRLDTLEAKTETDPVATEALKTARAELDLAITKSAVATEVEADLKAIQEKIDNLDLTKADKTSSEAATKAIADLTTRLDAGATDAELAAEIAKVNEAIANIKPAPGLGLTAEQQAKLDAIKLRSGLTEIWSAGALPNFGGVQAIAPSFAVESSPLISTPTFELGGGPNFIDFNIPTTVGKKYRLLFGCLPTATGNVVLRSNNNVQNFLFTGPDHLESHPGITVTRSGAVHVFTYEFVADSDAFISRITTGCPYNQGPVLLEVGEDNLYQALNGNEKRLLTDGDLHHNAFPGTLAEVLGQAFDLTPIQSSTFSPRSGVENAVGWPGTVSLTGAQNLWLRVIFDAPVRYVWILAQKAGGGAAVGMNMRNSASQNIKSFGNLRDNFLSEEAKWVLFDFGRVVERGSRILLSCSNPATSWFRVFDVQGYTDASPAAAPVATANPQILSLDRDFVEADFDDATWVQANQVIRDYTAWTWQTQVYLRVGRRVVKPLFPSSVEPMPAPSHDGAIALGGGVFENRLRGGTTVRYSSPKTTQDTTDAITFPAGVFSHFQYYFVDQVGAKIGNFGSNVVPLPAAFTGQSVTSKLPYPAGTVAIRFVLTRVSDGSELTYDVPV